MFNKYRPQRKLEIKTKYSKKTLRKFMLVGKLGHLLTVSKINK